MDSEKQKNISVEKDAAPSTILFASLVAVALLVTEIYLVIAVPHLLPAIALVGISTVACTYAAVSVALKRMQKNEHEQAEQYASILKSEKATYLLIRKYCDEIEEQMALMENKLIDPYQDVLAAQKATAKLTINRNKEHTDALMNSNDRLAEVVAGLEQRISALSLEIEAGRTDASDSDSGEILQKQTALASQLREMELGLKNELLQAVNQITSITPQVVMAPQMVSQAAAPQPAMSEPELSELPPIEESFTEPEFPELGALPELEPETFAEEELTGRENLLDIEPQVIEDPEPDEPVVIDPDIDAILNGIEAAELEPLAEPELSESKQRENLLDQELQTMTEQPQAAAEPELPPLPELEPLAEPEPIAESEPVEELPPMPDLSDPNKVMSPDDIAALLANMNTDAPAAELEPVAEPEPVEELPPMPDLSDPNKVMSADDIAALFANLG